MSGSVDETQGRLLNYSIKFTVNVSLRLYFKFEIKRLTQTLLNSFILERMVFKSTLIKTFMFTDRNHAALDLIIVTLYFTKLDTT